MRTPHMALVLGLAALVSAAHVAATAAGQTQSDLTSTVSSIAPGETNTFVDIALIGRAEGDLIGRWIRLVTTANPEGFVTRVLTFDSATGTFVLHDSLPSGGVSAGDTFHVGASPWSVGANGLSQFLMASPLPGCAPAGTDGGDVIVCRDQDFAGVSAGDGDDDVIVVAGATVELSEIRAGVVRQHVEATAVDTGAGDDSVLNAGAVGAAVTTVITPVVAPPAPIPGLPQAYAALFTLNSASTGIDLGAGHDEIASTGSVTTSASSTVLPGIPLGVVDGLATVDTSTKSNASATAIAGGDGDDIIDNRGIVSSSATASGVGVGISIVSVPDDQRRGRSRASGNVQATSSATGVAGGSGDDTVTNTATISSQATANALSVAGSFLEVKGNAAVSAQSTANAVATGIDLGPGDDELVNEGAVTATASARAGALSVAVAQPDDATEGNPALKSAVTGGARATARATGIGADGQTTESEPDADLLFNDGDLIGVQLQYSWTRATGNDTVENSGAVEASADALSGAMGASITLRGQSSSTITSTAEASAAAVDLGRGDDTLTNTGTLTATGTALASTRNAAIGVAPDSTGTGSPPTIKSAVAGSATARARAVGVSGDGADPDLTYALTLSSDDNVGLSVREIRTHAGGDDTVTNSGAIAATALATTTGQGASVTTGGSSAARLSSTADATAAGIDLGAGNDTLTNTNTGTISATAASTASAQNVALGISTGSTAASSAAEGGATARSRATGLSADSLTVDMDRTAGLEATTSHLTITLDQRETRGGGDDVVTNNGAITARADAWTDALGAGITINGAAAAKIQSTAEAVAAGIDLGAGHDTLTNTGTVTAEAAATALALNVALGLAGDGGGTPPSTPPTIRSGAAGSTTAEARAIGLSADSAVHDDIHLTAEATMSISSVRQTVEILQTRTHASGDDDVVNSGDITADATAAAGGIGVGVTIHGAAAAKLRSTAEADAAAVDLGGGGDTLTNTGTLSAAAHAMAGAIDVAVGVSGDSPTAKSAADARTTARARATGVSADSLTADTERSLHVDLSLDGLRLEYRTAETRPGGNDEVTNHGTVESHATALAGSLGAAVSVRGAASASTRATADASAIGIDLGGGADTLTNTGNLTVGADSTAGAVAAAISSDGRAVASDGLWKGGIEAQAAAVGIDGAGRGDRRTEAVIRGVRVDEDPSDGEEDPSQEEPEGDEGGDQADGGNALGRGLHARYETDVDPLSGDGADLVVNSGDIDVRAVARAGTITGAGTASGTAVASSDVEAQARAAGIRTGQGDDVIDNLGPGRMTVEADALAGAATVAVSGKGLAVAADALWDSGISASANAVGIDADGGARETTVITARIDGSGAEFVRQRTEMSASGADTVRNEQAIDVTASARTSALGVSVEAGSGLAATISSVSAQAAATAIRGGDGDDVIRNEGALSATADATAQALTIAFAQQGVAAAGNAVWDGGTQATATAVGLDADGGSASRVTTTTLTVEGRDAAVVHERRETAAQGNDQVLNLSDIDVLATANAWQAAAAATVRGVSAAVSESTAEATATAIRGGGGDDEITNLGNLTATAASVAEATNIAFAQSGVAAAGNSVWAGGTTATATAVGIDADGGTGETVTTTTLSTTGQGADVVHNRTDTAARGDDQVLNLGAIDARASAEARQASVAVTVQGVSAAVSESTAESTATAIRGGDGDDQVTNLGHLTATATSVAEAANVALTQSGVAVAANSVWDGGVAARATATGIAGDGGNRETVSRTAISLDGIDRSSSTVAARGDDWIVNFGRVDVAASADVAAVAGGVAIQGVAVALSTGTADARAAAIDAGDGDDIVINYGVLDADARASAVVINAAVTNAGVAAAANDVWDGGVTAEARGRGIDGGAGFDTIINAGRIEARTLALTPFVATAAVAVSGVAAAVSTSSTTSDATAIDAGGGIEADVIFNTGELTADARARSTTINVAVTNAGVAAAADAVWDGGTTATATARGIDAGLGADTISNTGAIDATADALSTSIGVAVAVSGIAAAAARSTANTEAIAIDAGEGQDDDVVTNMGRLTSTADSRAFAAGVAFTTAGVTVAGDAAWDGGTTARSTATGIRTGGGADTIDNTGEIEATTSAWTGAGEVSVALSGAAGAIATSTAEARSTAVDAGSGDDTIRNLNAGDAGGTGRLTAQADATAWAGSVSATLAGVAVSADAVWDGGTTASAEARGIDAGSGADLVVNEGAIDVTADARTRSVAVAFALEGVAAAVTTATGDARAIAIDTGDTNESDTVINSGALTARAETDAVSAGVGFTKFGVTLTGNDAWDGGTTGRAWAQGIFTGGGADTIVNAGAIDTTANARAIAASVSANVAGVAVAVSTATAEARATAIDAGEGDDLIQNLAEGTLTAEAIARGSAVNISATGAGVTASTDAVWDGGTHADAVARGIDGGAGNDAILNAAAVDARADASAASTSVAVTVIGVSGAISTASSAADAAGIAGGDGADLIDNRGDVSATSSARATGVSVSVSAGVAGAGDAVWDGGTRATGIATGLDGGAGDDRIIHSTGTVRADADATTHSVAVAASGLSFATTGSSATAQATGVDGGAGMDDVLSDSAVVSTATARAEGISVAVAAGGFSAAGTGLDNLTRAESTAIGIAGGAGNDLVATTRQASTTFASHAETRDTAVSVTVAGQAEAETGALAIAGGTGIDGGHGHDVLDNMGDIEGTASALARGRSVSVTLGGGSTGGSAGEAVATATGMDGGGGDDFVLNRGRIDIASVAEAFTQSVNVTGVGVGVSDAGATSRSLTTGLQGGAGVDIVSNRGTIDARASASTTARSTGVVPLGATLDRSNAEAEATAVGLDGGAGADLVMNAAGASLEAAASATTTATGVSLSVIGLTRGEAEMSPAARAAGLEGGSGDDVVINDGSVLVSATSSGTMRNSSVNILGSAGGSTGAVALAEATGMSGGTGDDLLLNRFSVGVDASSSSTVSGSSWSLGGIATDRSALEATAIATGIAGGAGADWLRNEGQIDVSLEASLNATGGSTAIFGGAGADTQLTARASGYGLSGGDDADTVVNAAGIRVLAEAAVEATRASVAFAGSPSSDALLVARAEATGLDGGTGADWLRNDGHLDVEASSRATIDGGARTTFGGTSASGAGTAEATGAGISAGSGANLATNAGSVDVSADAEAVVLNSTRSGWIVGAADTRADGRATVLGAGLLAGHGDNVLVNDGDVRTRVEAAAFGFADASGAHLLFNGDGTARAEGVARGTASGISAGDGRNWIVNTGRIEATAVASTVRNLRTTANVCSQEIVTVQDCHTVTDENGNEVQVCVDRQDTVTNCADQEIVLDELPTFANANGNGLDGDGRALAIGTATANAYGIGTGDGASTIVNTGDLVARASPNARAHAFADGDAFGDAIGTARATARATAVGILAGDGDNAIQNSGRIAVLADPTARAETSVTGGDICVTVLFWTWCGGGGDGIGTANATITAQAFGILAGDGNNAIVNDGTITVEAAPVVDGFTARVSNADTASVTTSVTSRAVGIQTGHGDNRILNAAGGVIDVTARDASACNGLCTTNVEAVGIQTGGGDDLIVNDGTVATSIVRRTGVITSGIAIDAGAGHDTVVLGLGSQTTGTVLLGSGNDTLVLTATAALAGTAFGGAGTDTFALGGAVDGEFELSEIGQRFREFDVFRKRDSSTWDLLGDRRIDWTVDEGTLGINGLLTGTVDTSDTAIDAVIAVRPTATVLRDDLLAPAVRLGGRGTLINEGTVSGVGDGVLLDGHVNVVTNHGAVTAAGTAIRTEGSQGLIVNDGLVTSVGAAAPAIALAGSGDSLVNRGIVTAQHAAVSLHGGQGGLVVNAGDGVLASTGGIAVVGGAGNDRVENHGRISGGAGIAIDLGAGDDELLITPGSVIEGVSFGGSGFDTMVLGGAGSGSFDLGGIGTSFQQFDLFAKQGPSVWTLFGQAAADWRVDEGALVIEGGILGSVFTGLNSRNPVIAVGFAGRVWREDVQAAVILNGGATLVNDGLVESTAFNGVALQALGSGNVVSNRGQIRALGTAFQLEGSGNQFSNSGLVQSLGTGAAVSVAGAGNTLANTGLVDASFGSHGVRVLGDRNAVFNAGRVQSGGAGVGIGGIGGLLVNTGTIAANTGVLIEGPQGFVSNAGAIFARGVGVALAGSGGAISTSGSITSNGAAAVAITGDRNALVNDGSVFGVTGVTMTGSGNTVVNRGRIVGGRTGIEATGDGTVIANAGFIGSGGTGVVLAGEATLSNQGTISARDTGVELRSGGLIVNAPDALIESASGVAIRGGEGRDRIENWGTIAGNGVAIDLGGGDDELRLAPGAVIEGVTDGGRGNDLLALGGLGLGRVNLEGFVNFETLLKDGPSRWTVFGSGELDWTVASGELMVEGRLLGAGTVEAGGRLGGSGWVGGLVNLGTVAPGSSIGTLTVVGDYEHGEEAILEIEGSITGLSDWLEVTGRAVLHGGTLSVAPETRPYGIATAHTVLRAGGGVTGAFATAHSGAHYLDAVLDHDPNSVTLTLIRNDISFLTMADTANLQALGSALDANKKAMAHGDFKSLMDQFLSIDEVGQRSALFSLSGELHPTTTRALHRTGQRFFSAAMDRQASARAVQDDHRTMWVDAFGFSGRLESDGNAAPASYRSVGLASGLDVAATETLRVGVSFGYAPGSTRLGPAGGGTARFRSYHPALYGEYSSGRWRLTTGAGYGHYQVQTTREIAVGQVGRQAAADYRASQISGLLRAGVMLRTAPTGSAEAFGELRYSTLRQQAFSESGAGGGGLTEMQLPRTGSLRSLLGVRLSWEPTPRTLRLRPQVTAGWAHEALDDRGQMTASLGGALTAAGFQPFTTRGLAESRDAAVLVVGATSGFSDNADGFLTYNGNLTGRGSEHGFVAGLRLVW
jgi:hypothetical protein